MFGFDVELPDSGQLLHGPSPIPQRLNRDRVERNTTQSGPRLRTLDLRPPGDSDDGLIDGDRGVLQIEVIPPDGTGLTPPHTRRRHEQNEGIDTGIDLALPQR